MTGGTTNKDGDKGALVLLSFSHCYPEASENTNADKEQNNAAAAAESSPSYADRLFLPDDTKALPCVAISSQDDLKAFCLSTDESRNNQNHAESSRQRSVLLELIRRTDAAIPSKANSLAFHEFIGWAKYSPGVVLEQFEFVDLSSRSYNSDPKQQRITAKTAVSLRQFKQLIMSRWNDKDEIGHGPARFGIQPSHSTSAPGNGRGDLVITPAMVSYEAWLSAAGLLAAPTLTSDVIGQILSFGGNRHEACWALSLTCSSMRQCVEEHCEKEFQAILQQHAVDDAFEGRVMQRLARNGKQPETNSAVIETPSWCKLCAAKQVPLYELAAVLREGDYDYPRTRPCVLTVNISPSENCIAVLLRSGWCCYVDVWNLSTKERERILIAENRIYSQPQNVVMLADDCFALAFEFGSIHPFLNVWSKEDNVWSRTIHRGYNRDGFALLPNQNELLSVDTVFRGPVVVKSLDTRNGVERSLFQLHTDDDEFADCCVLGLGLCDNKWLLILVDGYAKDDDAPPISGIYVCDLVENSVHQKILFEGDVSGFDYDKFSNEGDDLSGVDFQKMFQTSVDTRTVFFGIEGRVCILDLDETGHLSQRPLSFSLPGDIVGVFRNRIVMNDSDNSNNKCCSAYDIETGELMRSWERQCQRAVVAAKRNEILCASVTDNKISVTAFSLDE